MKTTLITLAFLILSLPHCFAQGASAIPLSSTPGATDDVFIDCDGTNCYASGLGKQYTASALAAWALTNTGANTSCSTGTTCAAGAFSSSLTNPSFLVAFVQWTGSTTTTVADTAGDTFTDCGAGSVQFSSVPNIQMFCATNNSHTTASNVITATFSGSSTFPRIFSAEFTGAATSSPVDVFSSSANQTTTGGTNALAITSLTTTGSNELILAGYGTQNNNITAGTSPNAFTLIGTPAAGHGFEYFVKSSAGAISPTAGDSGSDQWGGLAIAVKP